MNAPGERHIIIGTRGSDLALWQANFTKNILERAGFTAELNIIKTQGDRVQDLSFDKLEGKGFLPRKLKRPSWRVPSILPYTLARICLRMIRPDCI